MAHIQRLFQIDPWKIQTNSLDRENRRLQESMTSIGNGHMGIRGNFEEGYSADHHQGTYLAGVWYPDKTRVGWWKNGYPEYFGKVINAINFIAMDIYVNQQRLDLAMQQVSDFHLELDMKEGILRRSFTADFGETTVHFEFERFFSIVKQQLAVIKVKMTVVDGEASIKVVSKLDGKVHNEDSNYDELFWEDKASGNQGVMDFVTSKTTPNNFGTERFSVTAAMLNHADGLVEQSKTASAFYAERVFEALVTKGETVCLDKRVIVLSSRDVAEEQQVAQAEQLHEEYKDSFESLKAEQVAAWESRWSVSDVVIDGDEAAQQGIRFNLFQLFQTYYGEDERLNIGPKGFTGEKYGGATYWDTEAYAVPLYLALAEPTVTENLLKYRHNQLEGALHNAQQQGLKGALYPMVTFTGVECHNEWEITFEEIHRNGAIAYAIYNYTNYTGDATYLKKEGLEVLVEIARFWADRVHYSKRKDCYMIHGVTGPNEYENNVNNNWYTNTLAAWVLEYTLTSYRKYQEEATIEISMEEATKWEDIIAKMYYPTDEELGIFVQHDTFLDKELMPVDELPKENLPLNQKWSWDHILRSCFIKQADVLQGVYFFNDRYTLEEKRRNFEFYEPMTVHESSLSPSIHAILAAELGMEEKAVEMYERTARLDLDNYNNDTEDGLHITSMTGSWLAIVQGFAQMKTANEKLSFAPILPEKWTSYSFHINYRGRLLYITVTNKEVLIEKVSGEKMQMTVYGTEYELIETVICDMKGE